ncbi:polyprenyl synthetase family protein [Mesobacillus subterraneus]|uniref:polyprenyl synthetase family protein n=1 Tax=Mesobacillus subterraneus TaxID=285983 RepID=UPI00203C729D|nr:farnesyl diphosphate synthase [Mesobacillus subterraneus]MCM3665438.1 polyprenyl synthetase family protein [Mesobacillus subterraneus]MCM3684555.1 polyprenyl synthetase family protein [Mesobacillus subterraneus]
MDPVSLESFSKKYKALVEERLREVVGMLETPENLAKAMLYSLEAGGKRIRPLLLFAVIDSFGKNPKDGLDAAAAIEMVHTYSLIHDDLPSMDDDDLRRGKPTNHKVFGEATAILAGDALLTLSFNMLAELPEESVPVNVKLSLIKGLSKASGAAGMVGGQVADMEGEGRQLTLEQLEYIHINKTGKLLEYSIIAGAEIAGATEVQKNLLSKFAYHIGLAFQIRDDILDLEGTEEMIGKPVGSDTENDKSTYPALLGIEGAKEALDHHLRSAKDALLSTDLDVDILSQIADLIGLRNH